MSIALIGATGNAGSRILNELVRRGHTVTAVVRDTSKVPALTGVTAKAGDVGDVDGLAALIAGHDTVISSVHFGVSDPKKLIAAVRKAGGPRYIVVGGAGSLEVAPGTRLIDTPGFPEAYRKEANGGAAFLDLLRETDDIDWTFLSPSLEFVPGERIGKFGVGQDALLKDENGRSWISFEDYAVALVDEIVQPEHRRQRFTVGY